MKYIFLLVLPTLLISCRELSKKDRNLRSLEVFSFEKSKNLILNVLESDYKNDYLYYRLGALYDDNGNGPKAIQNYYKAIQLAPQKIDYYKALIPSLIENSRWEEAEENADILKNLAPSFYHAYYYLVESCVEQNKTEKAGKNLRTLSQINTGYPDLAYLKGRFYLANKDTLDAIYAFELSIDQNQRTNELVFYLTDLYLLSNEIEKAKKIIATYASKKDVNKFQLHKTLATIAELENDHKKQLKELKLAYQEKPDCQLRYPIVQHYLDKWKLDSAKIFLDTAITCDKDRDFYFYSGLVNYRSRNYEEALKNYKFATELAPNDSKVRWRYQQVFDIIYPPVVKVDSNTVNSQIDTTLSIVP